MKEKPVPVLVSWSSSRDSAWALHALRQQSDSWDVRGVFTTVTARFGRDARPGKRSDFTPVFPLWGADTDRLARTMIQGGLRAVVNAVDPTLAPETLAGRWFDRRFLADLPPGVDALGENGEFHTCVLDGPMFSSPVAARPGPVVRRPVAGGSTSDQRFTVYADLAFTTDS